MTWQAHGKARILALQADGVHAVAAEAILRAVGKGPVPLKNIARFKQLEAQEKNRNKRKRR